MRPTLAYPLVLATVVAAAAFNVQAVAETRHGCPDGAALAAEPAHAATPPVADDPAQPLDPRDPQFAAKSAQRYRAMDTKATQ